MLLTEMEEGLCTEGMAGRSMKVIRKGWLKHEKGAVWRSQDDVCLNSGRQRATQ